MVSKKFHYELQEELPKWSEEGIISPLQLQLLSDRYQLDQLGTTGRNNFVMILIGVGSALLGLGVITLVAANWQFWSREVRVLLLISSLIIINTTGFYLWNHNQQGWQGRLGQGLLLSGNLILGANLGLMSQLFHQSGPVYQLFLIWGLGVLAMTYGLRLNLLGITAILLLGIAYLIFLGEGSFVRVNDIYGIIFQQFPWLIAISFAPILYYGKSRWLFLLTALLVTISLDFSIVYLLDGLSGWAAGLVAGIGCILPSALLWGYRDSLGSENLNFESFAHRLAIVLMSLRLYLFSFNSIWQNSLSNNTQEANLFPLGTVVNLVIFSLIGLWLWKKLIASVHWNLSSQFVGVILLLTALIIAWQFTFSPLGYIATLIFNLLLFLLAVGLLRQSLAVGNRLEFWWGMTLLILQIMTRILEYNTGLVLKAVVLLLCGLTVIIAGLWFERYLRDFEQIL